MGWRTLFISNPCRLNIKDDNLVITPEGGESVRVPLHDISVVLIDTPQALFGSSLLSRLGENNILMIVCDDTHTPNGIFTPYATHSRHTKSAKAQITWSEPLKKRLWQSLIKSKITNQAKVLEYAKKPSVKYLQNLASKVTSGDTGNLEAQSASVYWQSLFEEFVRGGVCLRNSALNYGYAIIRSAIARNIASSGFVGAFGVHHDNELNAFNLADDLIEPYRPFVDLLVWRRFGSAFSADALTKEDKVELVSLLGESCYIGGRHESLLNAIEITVQSLMRASFDKEPSKLLFPEFARL